MLSRLRAARSAGFLCNDSSFHSQKRPRSSCREPPTSDPDLSYLKNPGSSPLLETTIGKLLESAAERWPSRDCVISLHQSQRLSFSQLLKRADKLAAGFKEIGLKKGDRIGIWGPNSIEWLLSYMAGARAGLVVAAVNSKFQIDELDYCLWKIGAAAVVAPKRDGMQNYAEMLLAVKRSSPTLNHIIVHGEEHVAGTRRFKDVEELAGRQDVEAVREEQVEISSYSPTNIQFTSGTTGNPKAALLVHRSLVNNSRQGVTRSDISNEKVCLNLPYFHAFGMIVGVVGPLHAGATMVLESPTFDPAKSIDAIAGEKCSMVYGTPTMFTNMMDVMNRTGLKVDSLRSVCIGGAPASSELCDSIRDIIGARVTKAYGSSEATAIINQTLPDESYELTQTTVGRISDHIEVKVVDSSGDLVPFDTPGELCVRGYNTMLGYWGDEENTRKAMSDDDWLRTGDRYILRKDGYGEVVGRMDSVLETGGENIFSKLERFLETHPAILEAHAFSVHDDVYGEEICACIRLKSGANVDTEDIVNYARGKFLNYKIPRYVFTRAEFPRTTEGRIEKRKLKEELEDEGVVPRMR